jgi:hypothetical protein
MIFTPSTVFGGANPIRAIFMVAQLPWVLLLLVLIIAFAEVLREPLYQRIRRYYHSRRMARRAGRRPAGDDLV